MKVLIVISFMLAIVSQPRNDGAEPQRVAPNAPKARYPNPEPQERTATIKAWLDQRPKVINDLISVLERRKGEKGYIDDEEYKAIVWLGELRAVEAVDPLIEIVDKCFVTFRLSTLKENKQEYVVPKVLARIGKEARDKCLESLAKEDNESRVMRLLETIILIEGPDLAREAIRLARDQSHDEKQKQRLDGCLTRLAKHK